MKKMTLLLILVSLVTTPCFADALPHLKSGLWSMQTNAGPMPITAEYCIDDATQQKMFEKNGDMGACSKPTVEKSGSTYLITTTCNRDGKVRTVKSKMNLQGDTAFTGETQVNGTVLESTGTYLSPCKPGQKPGDMQIKGPGGMDFNLGDVQKMMQGLSQNMR